MLPNTETSRSSDGAFASYDLVNRTDIINLIFISSYKVANNKMILNNMA